MPGERIFIDICSIMHPSAGGRKHWFLIVDEATDYAHSIFPKQKSGQVKILIQWIKNMGKKHNVYIKKTDLIAVEKTGNYNRNMKKQIWVKY